MEPVPAADAAARAVLENLRLLVGQLELGWIRSSGEATVAFTAVPVPTLNGVWVDAAHTTPEEIEAGLDMVTVNEVPYSIQARPGCASVAAVMPGRRAMLTAPEIGDTLARSPTGAPRAHCGAGCNPATPATAFTNACAFRRWNAGRAGSAADHSWPAGGRTDTATGRVSWVRIPAGVAQSVRAAES